MKIILITVLLIISSTSCETKKIEYASFGEKITEENALTKEEVFVKYKSLKKGDTIALKFKSEINEICQNKGCWMTLTLEKDEKAFVKFKDYAFFVPMNVQNRMAIVEGKAFVEETSIAQLQHYAEDEGKSKAAIDSINSPKVEMKFLAHGVLIEK